MELRASHFFPLSMVLLLALGHCTGQSVLPPGPLSGMVGGNVTFQTIQGSSSQSGYLTITWNFNGQKGLQPVVTVAPKGENIQPAYAGRVQVNHTTGTLYLSTLTMDDTGLYSVTLVTDTGITLLGETNLVVYEPVSVVTATANVSSPVEFNDTVSLQCAATGSSLSFRWFNGSSQMEAKDRVSLTDRNRTLVITGVLRFDMAPITCTAFNVLMSRTSNPVLLNVSSGPENAATVTFPPKNLFASGDNVTLNCSAQSTPPAQYQWLFNGNLLPQTGQQLSLSGLAELQSGNYTCLASNSKSLRYAAAAAVQITVLQKLNGTMIKGPSAPVVAGNSSVNLTCQATSGSASTKEWVKDGTPLSPSNKLVMSSDKASVYITSVQKSDRGQYQCKLTNPVSSDSSSYTLVVNYGPEKISVEGNKEVEEGKRVTMKCFAESVPPAIFSWSFNGSALQGNASEYVIEHALYEHTGSYACMTSNAVTGLNASAIHKLAVKAVGSIHEPLTGGAIAGIVIGVLVGVIIIALVFRHCRESRRKIESPY